MLMEGFPQNLLQSGLPHTLSSSTPKHALSGPNIASSSYLPNNCVLYSLQLPANVRDVTPLWMPLGLCTWCSVIKHHSSRMQGRVLVKLVLQSWKSTACIT